MIESVFRLDGDGFSPTPHARGPWDPHALHGGAPAALMTEAFERTEPGSELRIARLGFEFLRPIPMATLRLSTRVIRAGRRAQELAGELHAGEQLICRAGALRVQEVPAGLPVPAAAPETRMPGPEHGTATRFALEGSSEEGFGAAMEMRWLDDPNSLGPGRVWMRLRYPLLPEEPTTPLALLTAVADFGNGVSAELPFDGFLFINADLTIHLQRAPGGDWIGLDARTKLAVGGAGLAESVLHDEHGPVGRAFQALVVQAR
jgi:acyl-Coa thioesterase superfamily protein/acyl-CoA thioesterase superfamily protein